MLNEKFFYVCAAASQDLKLWSPAPFCKQFRTALGN